MYAKGAEIKTTFTNKVPHNAMRPFQIFNEKPYSTLFLASTNFVLCLSV